MIEELRKQLRHEKLIGSYGGEATRSIFKFLTEDMNVVGKHGLVVGSQVCHINKLIAKQKNFNVSDPMA